MTALSLVICTRNRAAQLERCLAAVGRCASRHAWELVIVDNGSSDGTAQLIEAWRRDCPFPVVTTREARPGLGRARNVGIRAARGAYLAFTDDDCYPRADYVDRVVEIFETRDVGWLAGAVALHDPTDYPLTVSYLSEDRLLPPGRFLWTGLIHGANMAFRRETLLAIGGFDPDLGPGTPFVGDDIDAAARASAAGWGGGFFTAPLVYHHHRRKAEDAKLLLRTYDFARGAYFAKLLVGRSTRRCFGWRVLAELTRSAATRPGVLCREIAGGVSYLRRGRSLAKAVPDEIGLTPTGAGT